MAHFNAHSAGDYDSRILRLVPGYMLLQQLIPTLLSSVLSPGHASILVSGAGTGCELVELARHRADWHMVGIDPSSDMLALARRRSVDQGVQHRTELHAIPLAEYTPHSLHHAAISLLVAHFLSDAGPKAAYFSALRECLEPGAPLIFADLVQWRATQCREAYRQWAIAQGQTSEEAEIMLGRIRDNFHPVTDDRLEQLLKDTGFSRPISFFQALDYRGYITFRE